MKSLLYMIGIISSMLYISVSGSDKIEIVTTLSTYADIARHVGKEKVNVQYIAAGDQDAHFVRPKPSFAVLLNKADLFVTTGLDLELWVPTLVDMSKNNKIRSGEPGYVAAYDGIELLEKPAVLSRSEGDLHIYGNPHITTNPLIFKIIAENIAIGLEKIDPAHSDFFRDNLINFQNRIDIAVFGEELVQTMGGELLTRLARSGQLIKFLKENKYKDQTMITYLGGWLKDGMAFRGKKVVAYHKNWAYFKNLFGISIIGFVEPKPGIPPSPRHVKQLIDSMRRNQVKVVLAANYFDENKVRNICEKVGAIPVIVPLYVEGAAGTEDIFKLVDYWIKNLRAAFEQFNL